MSLGRLERFSRTFGDVVESPTNCRVRLDRQFFDPDPLRQQVILLWVPINLVSQSPLRTVSIRGSYLSPKSPLRACGGLLFIPSAAPAAVADRTLPDHTSGA